MLNSRNIRTEIWRQSATRFRPIFHVVSMFSGILVKIKKLYDPFLWIRFNCLREAEPLIRHSLLFTIKSPEALGIHLIDIGRVKGWINLGATLWSKFCSTFESIQILRKTDILCKPYSPEFNPSIYFNTIS